MCGKWPWWVGWESSVCEWCGQEWSVCLPLSGHKGSLLGWEVVLPVGHREPWSRLGLDPYAVVTKGVVVRGPQWGWLQCAPQKGWSHNGVGKVWLAPGTTSRRRMVCNHIKMGTIPYCESWWRGVVSQARRRWMVVGWGTRVHYWSQEELHTHRPWGGIVHHWVILDGHWLSHHCHRVEGMSG